MNLSRLATLAVFFMMVMSAFVTVPTYNVGADDHEGSDDDNGDEHDHDEHDHDEHDHDHDDHDDHDDRDGGDPTPDYYHAVMTMNSIDNFTIEIQGEFLAERADEMRSQLADFCITMPDSDGSVITDECFEMWLAMIEESDDDHHDDDGMPSPQDLLNMADSDGDSLLTFDEFWNVFSGGNQDDSHTDDYNHHDESTSIITTVMKITTMTTMMVAMAMSITKEVIDIIIMNKIQIFSWEFLIRLIWITMDILI